MKVSERWLRDYVTVNRAMGEVAKALTMAGLEVKNLQENAELHDIVFEVEITSNRPDWLSYLGIAREVAALFDAPTAKIDFAAHCERMTRHDFAIDIKEKSLCPFYAGVIIEGILNKTSPNEIQDKLRAIGLRPINLIVDLTNIVLFETGQPMHAFDLEHLRGNRIIVRRAKKGEKFAAINHGTYTLRDQDLLICDAERPVALAGIMGGSESEVRDTTRTILLESAFFDPATIRSTSRFHVLQSDSSYRFERKVDLGMVRKAQDRFINLLKKYTSVGNISAVISDGSDALQPKVIALDLREIPETIGIDIDARTVKNILEKLGLEVKHEQDLSSCTRFSVQVPTFRPDLERSIDLLEEITRIYGYDKVPETLPPRIPHKDGLESTLLKVEQTVKDVCVASGCFEVVPFTLLDENKCGDFSSIGNKFVRIVNPQNKDLRLMRPSLIPSMLEVVAANMNYGNTDLKLFEIGSRYMKSGGKELPFEIKTCCVAVTGASARTWFEQAEAYSFFDLKGIVENVFDAVQCPITCGKIAADYLDKRCSFSIMLGHTQIGALGTVMKEMCDRYGIEQDVFIGEFDLEALSGEAVLERTFSEISKFPVVKRDIAVIVGHDILVADMQEEILINSDGLIKQITVIDNFTGKHVPEGKKNVAFSMTFAADDRTLSGDEIQEVNDAIFRALEKKFKAEYRTL
jgi:phenylalanyl-tRNA synthetase beta chain